jgi:hypothetical protein
MSELNQNVADSPTEFPPLDPQLLNIVCDGSRRQMGFSPLINPIDGSKYGDETFSPYWDSLLDHGGWFELTVTFSEEAFGFIFKDDDAVDANVRKMCREFAQ